jgi:hypothetical protein
MTDFLWNMIQYIFHSIITYHAIAYTNNSDNSNPTILSTHEYYLTIPLKDQEQYILYLHVPYMDILVNIIIYCVYICAFACIIILGTILYRFIQYGRQGIRLTRIMCQLYEYTKMLLCYSSILISFGHPVTPPEKPHFITYTGAIVMMLLVFAFIRSLLTTLFMNFFSHDCICIHAWFLVIVVGHYIGCVFPSLLYIMWLQLGIITLVI